MKQYHDLIVKAPGWYASEFVARNSNACSYYREDSSGSCGRYIEVQPSGTVIVGYFNLATPYIADAIFRSVQVISHDLEAALLLVEAHLNILGCPFCGNQPHLAKSVDRTFLFRCEGCIDSPEFLIYYDLLEWWNRRY